eukprot:6476880-Amphidinium_carterae.1
MQSLPHPLHVHAHQPELAIHTIFLARHHRYLTWVCAGFAHGTHSCPQRFLLWTDHSPVLTECAYVLAVV